MRVCLDAPQEAPFDPRGVIGGMANAFGPPLIAMGRVKYALHWPTHLRIEFVTLWQEVSTSRTGIFGSDLEPSVGAPCRNAIGTRRNALQRKWKPVGIWAVRTLWRPPGRGAPLEPRRNMGPVAIGPPRKNMELLTPVLPRLRFRPLRFNIPRAQAMAPLPGTQFLDSGCGLGRAYHCDDGK